MDDIFYKRVLIFTLTVTMIVFQNCSRVEFSAYTPKSKILALASINPDEPNNCTFNNQTILHGGSIVTYFAANVAYGLSCESEVRSCHDGVLSGSFTANTCTVANADACVFNGQNIPHGSSVTAYQNASVTFGGTCQSENRACANGFLSGSYNFANCNVANGNSCTFNGQTIAHGASVTAYVNSSVDFGGTCTNQTRACYNGTLSGSYAFASCSIGAPNSCLFNGQTVAHGASVTAYQNSSAAFDGTCVEQTRTCNNGSLSGAYAYASCNVDQPNSCLFNGETVAHGQTVVAYTVSSVPFGSTCNQVNRTCNNGVLSGAAGFASCNVDQPNSCFLNGQTIAHGSSTTAYLIQDPAYGVSCTSQVRSCNNGTLDGSYMQSACTEKICNPNTYTSCGAFANGISQKLCNAQGSGYGSCVQSCHSSYYMSGGVCVKDCSFNGGNVAHGASTTAYLTQDPAYGVSCTSQVRSCNLGALSGSYTATSCTEKICNPNTYTSCGALANGTHQKLCNAQGSGYGSCEKTCAAGYYLSGGSCVKDCSFNGSNVAHGASVTAYQSASPPYGTACASENRTCQNGTLSGSYTATSCTRKACDPGSYTSCGSLANGSNIAQCNAQGSGYGSCAQYCNNGYVLYGGQCYLKQCEPGSQRTCYYMAYSYSGDGQIGSLVGAPQACLGNGQWDTSGIFQYPDSFGFTCE